MANRESGGKHPVAGGNAGGGKCHVQRGGGAAGSHGRSAQRTGYFAGHGGGAFGFDGLCFVGVFIGLCGGYSRWLCAVPSLVDGGTRDIAHRVWCVGASRLAC